MNWVQKNPFLTGYLAATVIGAGALGYLLYSSYSNYAAVSESYDSQVLQLQRLQNTTPFPSDENNAKFEALTAEYQTATNELLDRVQKMQLPVEQITPQTFQDRLRAVVSEIVASAEGNNVTLPENFYMGFDKYQTSLPRPEAAGVLARQLAAIKIVVDDLITLKVGEIVGVSRTPLPEESGAPEPTPQPRASSKSKTKGGATATKGPEVLVKNSFEITFIADQARTRQSLNAIVRAEPPFIIRALNIQNSQMEGPPRVAPPESAAPADGSVPAEPTAPALRQLVGSELLTVSAKIEIISLATPAQ